VRRIFIFALESPRTAAMIDDFRSSVAEVAPETVWSVDSESADHVIMLLSKGCVDPGTASAALLEQAVSSVDASNKLLPSIQNTLNFIFIEASSDGNIDEAWDFDEFYALHTREPSIATRAISAHEALKFREKTHMRDSLRRHTVNRYEHDAMILEILRRVRGAVPVRGPSRRKSILQFNHRQSFGH
jgi:hypothetical protein